MYNKNKSVLKSESIDIDSMIEDDDIFNSKFIFMLSKLPYGDVYTINLSKYRIDLISVDIYGSSDYAEILLLYNGINISELKPGVVLKIPYLKDIKSLMSRISTIKNPREFLKNIEN